MHDIILNKMKLIKEIKDEKITKILTNKDLKMMLKLLYKPVTIEEIEKSFKEFDRTKSSKTIYRYLATLKKAGLVIEAGKRIKGEDNQNITNQTLFCRSASIFTLGFDYTVNDKEFRENLSIIKKILEQKYQNDQEINFERFELFFQEVSRKKMQLILNFLNDSQDLFADISGIVEWTRFFNLIDIISWFMLFNEQNDIFEQFMKLIKGL